ncbi:MAG TPA: hypothetical protein VFO79_02410 [Xanthomonadales bacterium]|nr:hypothetical protein [Xanthomonadales bacterium]
MRKLLKVVLFVVVLAAAWVAIVLSEWLPRPTQVQLDAVALLEKEPDGIRGERDAFPAMWFYKYDVPESELEALMADDVKAWSARAAQTLNVTGFTSVAEGRYPLLPEPASKDPLLCEPWGADCLARVRADVEASRAQLAKFAQRLQRGDRLDAYDHVRYRFRPRFDSPIAGPGNLFTLQLTAAALDYVDGKRDEAFARLCRNTATWRRFRTHTDTLIIDMLAVAQMTGAAKLHAEMLAEQPAGFAAPCPDVFAPMTDAELDQCAVFRQEYLFLTNTLDDAIRHGSVSFDGTATTAAQRLFARLVNRRHVVHVTAQSFARMCGAPQRERIARRDPSPLPALQGCSTLDRLVDPVGCEVFMIEVPAYDDYYKRVLDLDARLKLLATAVWLRAQPADGDRAAQFATRPKTLDSAMHGMTIDTSAGLLRMNNLAPGRGAVWDIPYGAAAPAAVETPAGAGTH